MKYSIIFLILTSWSISQAACKVGQLTQLGHPVKVTPCGEFDIKTKTCTDTTPVTLKEGTLVHLTEIKGHEAEVFVGYIPSEGGQRYINQFAKLELGSAVKSLSCDN